MNTGKIFEHDFKESCTKQGIFALRINDTYYTAKQYDPKAFVPQQICDYILHYNGTLFMTELKTTDKKYMTIEGDKAGMIKKHQYDQMARNENVNEHGLFILQFCRDTEDEMTYALKITDFMNYLKSTNKCSINRLDVVQHGGIQIEQAVSRVRKHYNIKSLLDKLEY